TGPGRSARAAANCSGSKNPCRALSSANSLRPRGIEPRIESPPDQKLLVLEDLTLNTEFLAVIRQLEQVPIVTDEELVQRLAGLRLPRRRLRRIRFVPVSHRVPRGWARSARAESLDG